MENLEMQEVAEASVQATQNLNLSGPAALATGFVIGITITFVVPRAIKGIKKLVAKIRSKKEPKSETPAN